MHKVSHTWLYGSVRPYFEKKGIKLLKDDMVFIEKWLANIPPYAQRFVMRDYLMMWLSVEQEKEKSSPIAVNGRFKANNYLMDEAERWKKAATSVCK